jgi:hypothetical protein
MFVSWRESEDTATDSDSVIRWFKSIHPSHSSLQFQASMETADGVIAPADPSRVFHPPPDSFELSPSMALPLYEPYSL